MPILLNESSGNAPVSESLSQFRLQCLSYAEHLKEAGVTILPYQDESLPLFSALPLEAQVKARAAIQADLSIFDSIKNEGSKLRDSSMHVWRFLRSSELTPESDIFDKITDDDVVEVYLADEHGQRQIFRNLKFLECVSLTVEQLYGMDWRVSTQREPQYEKAIFDAAMSIMTGEVPGTLPLQIAPHYVQELNSPGLFTLLITMKYLSPIRYHGRVVGALVINHSQVVGTLK